MSLQLLSHDSFCMPFVVWNLLVVAKMTSKVYIGKLSPAVTPFQLKQLCENHGKVSQADIIKDYAFVHFENEEQARNAVNRLNGLNFMGTTLRVQFSYSKGPEQNGGVCTWLPSVFPPRFEQTSCSVPCERFCLSKLSISHRICVERAGSRN